MKRATPYIQFCVRFLCFGMILGALCANVQTFPTKPIRLVVPCAGGGVRDITASLVTQKMSEDLGPPILIDNKPGTGLTTGMEFVAKSPSDGYTKVIAGNGLALAKSLFKSLAYDIVAKPQMDASKK